MIDRIFDLEDFGRIINNEELECSDLRICIEDKTVDQYNVYHDIAIILTISKGKNQIMEWRKIHRTTTFFRDKNSKEQKDFVKWKDQTLSDIERMFGKGIIDGRWIDGGDSKKC